MKKYQFLNPVFLVLLHVHTAVLLTNDFQNFGFSSVPNGLINKQAWILYLDFNNLATIDSSTDFFGCLSLQTLTMTNNLFEEFPFMPNIASTLRELSIGFNKIKTINSTRVQSLVKLEMVDFTDNLLTSFPDFYHPTLKSLGLTKNQFKTIPNLPYLGKNLQSLDIGSNLIQSIDISALTSYAKLIYINLALNNLTTFPNYCVGTGMFGYGIIANGNNWNCDCRLRWILLAKMVARNSGFYPQITCSSPPRFAGQDLLTLTPSQLTCDGKYT